MTASTKQQEIERLDAFVKDLPKDSYLKDYMAGSVPHFEQMIRADIVEPLYHANREARNELVTIREEIRKVQIQLYDEKQKLDLILKEQVVATRAITEMGQLADTIRDKANAIDWAVKKYGTK